MQQRLYDLYAAKMLNVCLRFTRNSADAEDILQEGFVKVFKNLDKFRSDGSFEGWIRRIITRTAISHFRDHSKKAYSNTTEISYRLEDKEASAMDRLGEKDIVGMVKKLAPGYRKVFMLYVIDGYNHKEIANLLGCSEGNCKSQLYRSRTMLQKMMSKTA
jgi:RNA polymerase sigma factor (sigma-70 family)